MTTLQELRKELKAWQRGADALSQAELLQVLEQTLQAVEDIEKQRIEKASGEQLLYIRDKLDSMDGIIDTVSLVRSAVDELKSSNEAIILIQHTLAALTERVEALEL